MDKLFELFKSADEKTSWVRVPVINYLRACPLPRAKDLLAQCEKIDPAAVKRANTFFPTTPSTSTQPSEKSSKTTLPGKISTEIAAQPAAYEAPIAAAAGTQVAAAGAVESIGPPAPPPDDELAAVNRGAEPAAALKKTAATPPNLWALLGVPWLVGLGLAFVQWRLLRGGR
jgi:hypothetical protein